VTPGKRILRSISRAVVTSKSTVGLSALSQARV
jgi:hypothetical protein